MRPESMSTEQIEDELRRFARDDYRLSRYARGNAQVRIGELERERERRRDRYRDRRALGLPEMVMPQTDSHGEVDPRVAGHLAVIGSRLGTLQLAIRSREWESVEFQYDRVASAVGKLEELLRGER